MNEAYEAAGRTYDYFRRVHGRRSLDDRGLGIRSIVHYGKAFNNVAVCTSTPASPTRGGIGPRSRFQHCADATWRAARELYGTGSEPHDAVRAAWAAVGIEVHGTAAREAAVRPAREVVELPVVAAELPHLG